MMTDSQERDVPTLEDEIFGAASAGDDKAGPDESVPEEQTPVLLRVRWPWESIDRPARRDLVLMVAGFTAFIFVDLVIMSAPLSMSQDLSLLPFFIILVLLAFGLGGLMVWQIRGSWRPVGVGMMLGWVFLTLVSVGFLTGIRI